jgi:hypothetical protein
MSYHADVVAKASSNIEKAAKELGVLISLKTKVSPPDRVADDILYDFWKSTRAKLISTTSFGIDWNLLRSAKMIYYRHNPAKKGRHGRNKWHDIKDDAEKIIAKY